MAISQGSNLINVVVHNGADSRGASLSAIILSHALVVGWGRRVLGGIGVGGATLAPNHLNLLRGCLQVLQRVAKAAPSPHATSS